MFFKIDALKNSTIFTENTCLFLVRLQARTAFFIEHYWSYTTKNIQNRVNEIDKYVK